MSFSLFLWLQNRVDSLGDVLTLYIQAYIQTFHSIRELFLLQSTSEQTGTHGLQEKNQSLKISKKGSWWPAQSYVHSQSCSMEHAATLVENNPRVLKWHVQMPSKGLLQP